MLILMLTRIYILGIAAVWINAASTLMFAPMVNKQRLRKLALAAALSPFWPLAIFSPEGRKKLLITTSTF